MNEFQRSHYRKFFEAPVPQITIERGAQGEIKAKLDITRLKKSSRVKTIESPAVRIEMVGDLMMDNLEELVERCLEEYIHNRLIEISVV